MIKKNMAQCMLAVTLTTGMIVAAVIDPNTRLEKVRDLFTKYGAETFKLLNGLEIGGTEGDGLTDLDRANISYVTKSPDPNAFVFCVREGKWAAYPPEPTKVNTNAMTATDSNNVPFVKTLVSAMGKSPDGKARITYYVKTPGGQEKREATVWSSRNLLTRKNNTGTKFFCGTSIRSVD